MNYNEKKFKPVSISENGEVTSDMIFHYTQQGNILTCAYQGENIIAGHLLGIVDGEGNIDMRYHQVNKKGELMTGTCLSKPEVLATGKIRLHEKWQWTSGKGDKGESLLEEI